MGELTDDQVRQVYRQAIEPVEGSEDAAWWIEVVAEIRQVIAARTVGVGAAVINWWHHDWSMVDDTPVAAAKRIRDAAKALLHRSRKFSEISDDIRGPGDVC